MRRQHYGDVTVTHRNGSKEIRSAGSFRKSDEQKREHREILVAKQREERESDSVMD